MSITPVMYFRTLVLAVTMTAGTASTLVAQNAAPIFQFHNGFWVNLHSFLYVLGRAANGESDATRTAVVNAPRDLAGFDAVSAGDQAAWHRAVAFYQDSLSKLDPVFDDELIGVTMAMARAGNMPSLESDALDEEHVRVLMRVAPTYRAVWWPRHQAANNSRVGELEAQLARHGSAVLARATQVYGGVWPPDGRDVEISAYTNWAGAYSTGLGDQSLILVSSLDRDYAGLAGLEMVFHEAMHQWDDEVFARVRAVAIERGVRFPRGFTHALIFFTAGEIVRQIVPDHVPYAEAHGMWGRLVPGLKPHLDAHWLPYVRGEGTFEQAMGDLLVAFNGA